LTDMATCNGHLHLSRERRDVPERNTRERGLRQISNVRARGRRLPCARYNLNQHG
jgi:hypothetical protein